MKLDYFYQSFPQPQTPRVLPLCAVWWRYGHDFALLRASISGCSQSRPLLVEGDNVDPPHFTSRARRTPNEPPIWVPTRRATNSDESDSQGQWGGQESIPQLGRRVNAALAPAADLMVGSAAKLLAHPRGLSEEGPLEAPTNGPNALFLFKF